MLVDFVRFAAADGLELQGWWSDSWSDTAVIHIHGMADNGQTPGFVDRLRSLYSQRGIAFFSINTRGHGVISTFRQGKVEVVVGSCHELFEESVHDIHGAISYVLSRGKTRVILQGHSLGASKVINYLSSYQGHQVVAVLLLAPTDMIAFARSSTGYEDNLLYARELVNNGRSRDILPLPCWIDDNVLSAQAYLSLAEPGRAADIYGQRDNGAVLTHVQQPMLIVYGGRDLGLQITDGSFARWRKRTLSILNSTTTVTLLENAPHAFQNYEDELANVIDDYIRMLLKL